MGYIGEGVSVRGSAQHNASPMPASFRPFLAGTRKGLYMKRSNKFQFEIPFGSMRVFSALSARNRTVHKAAVTLLTEETSHAILVPAVGVIQQGIN